METSREQFTFYASFALALRRIKKMADRCAAYDAIVNYALYKTEPDLEKLPDAAAIAFDLIRPNLDASRKKAKGGKGNSCWEANAEQSGKTAEANEKDSGKIAGTYEKGSGKITGTNGEDSGNKKEKENETEKEKEGEIEKEKEDECLSIHPCRMPPPDGPETGERRLRPLPELPRQSTGVPPPNPGRPQPGDPLYMDKAIQAVKRWKAAGKEGWINDYF